MLNDDTDQNENTEMEAQSVAMSEEAFRLVEGLLEAAKQAEIQELEESEIKYLEENGLSPAKYYKVLATIDLAHNDNIAFRQGIMLLVDVLVNVQENHPEILVAGESEEEAEVQLVASEKETLENIPYEDAEKFLSEARDKMIETA